MTTLQQIESLTPEQHRRAMELVLGIAQAQETDQLSTYLPYPFQLRAHCARDHEGNAAHEVVVMTGNQCGKTWFAGRDLAIHATGLYPEWWDGKPRDWWIEQYLARYPWTRGEWWDALLPDDVEDLRGPRFTRPGEYWAGSPTNVTTRDVVQDSLLGTPGDPDAWGSGAIPRSCLGSFTREDGKSRRYPGVPDALDSVHVKHVSGGWSHIQFKSYEMGKLAWTGKRKNKVWLDEEPPQEILSQAVRATARWGGHTMLSFTPEQGSTQVVEQFMFDNIQPGQALVRAALDDLPDLTEAEITRILSKYPEHERAMRRRGDPQFGAGLIYTMPEEEVVCDVFPIPDHWWHIAAVDLGYKHPAAGVWLAWDQERDITFLYDSFKVARQTPEQHAPLMKRNGEWIPWAWPHDASTVMKDGGPAMVARYRTAGVRGMLPVHFTNPPGPDGRENISKMPGITHIQQREMTGRRKIFRNQIEVLQERRIYHFSAKDGKPVTIGEDLMSADRYAHQMGFLPSQVPNGKYLPRHCRKRPAPDVRPQDTADGVTDYDPYNPPMEG